MEKQIPVKKNQLVEIQIDDIGNDGQGIGKVEGFTIFVDGGLPGDIAEVLILKVGKRFAFGKAVRFIVVSPNRAEPKCPNAGKCGGCQLQHLSYESQLKLKTKRVIDVLERIGGIENPPVLPVIGMEEPYFYRNKAQFPVGYEKGELKIGFYAKRSHRIVNTETCCIQHPINDKILAVMRKYMIENSITTYDEERHKGLVRHVLTKVGFQSGEIMVCIVANGAKLPNHEKLIEDLIKISGVVSIVLNINRNRTNVILGDKTVILWGKGEIQETLCGLKFNISPHSFFQVNPIQTEVLYNTALTLADLKGTERVLDLYCGIGTISLLLAQKAKEVLGIEVISQAVEDAEKNAAINQIRNVDFLAGDVEALLPQLYKEGKHAEVIVVDPPRKGLTPEVIQAICTNEPEKVVYVSCDPGTLARDIKLFIEKGYSLGKVQPVDQFCQTVNVESVCLLTRK